MAVLGVDLLGVKILEISKSRIEVYGSLSRKADLRNLPLYLHMTFQWD